jgi:DNA-binding transcriptional MerR regulator
MFGLSRTALLYYESIGLLSAVARSESNYRLYSDDSAKRLERICTYKDAGVPLTKISNILDHEADDERDILEKTLLMLNQKAQEIKNNQDKITAILNQELADCSPVQIDLRAIMDSLTQIGFGEDVFLQIHGILEHKTPDGHLSFLKLCGFSDEEISRILSAINP